ncbi:MAG: hypothetical protein BGN92_09825 [Sphingobacteriales bacterium 41-5]|nr:MAG: hypothetical protein BGN92_09825 [Sphingobacteriales bacterium 41-5]
MERKDKIKILELVKAGKIKTEDLQPLPNIELKPLDNELSNVTVRAEHEYHLCRAYKCQKTGKEFTAEEAKELIERRNRYTVGAIVFCFGQDAKLYAGWILCKEITSNEQAEILLQHFTDAGSVPGK